MIIIWVEWCLSTVGFLGYTYKSTKKSWHGSDPPPLFWQCQDFQGVCSGIPSLITQTSAKKGSWNLNMWGCPLQFHFMSSKLFANSLIGSSLKKIFLAHNTCWALTLLDFRDGKSIQNSTDENFSKKNSTKTRISRHISICAKLA